MARELHDWFTPGLTAAGDRFVGYLDDGDDPMRGTGHDLPQLGTVAGYRANPEDRLVMAIASPAGKQEVAARILEAGGVFASLVHPTAWVSASARIGQGVVVGVFADVSSNATVHDFATINGYSSVGHDAVLGEYATLSGYVDLTGFVTVGRGSFLGSGARVLPRLSIGERCVVGAGSVVVRSVGDDVTLYAAPARRL